MPNKMENRHSVGLSINKNDWPALDSQESFRSGEARQGDALMERSLSECRELIGTVLADAMRTLPRKERKFRLFMVAALSEHVWRIVPAQYRRIVYYIERLADSPGLQSWRSSAADDVSELSGAENREARILYESLGVTGSGLDMMCRKAMRGFFDETDILVWTMLANPFFDGFGPALVGYPECKLSERWSTAISCKEELDGLVRAEGLIECILSPTTGAVRIDPAVLAWNGGMVSKLARAIYEDRRFDELPILGDALEEAGCCDGSVLSHCHQPGQPHARGCWVVDLLIGKGDLSGPPRSEAPA